jgi:hypothetical protein
MRSVAGHRGDGSGRNHPLTRTASVPG